MRRSKPLLNCICPVAMKLQSPSLNVVKNIRRRDLLSSDRYQTASLQDFNDISLIFMVSVVTLLNFRGQINTRQGEGEGLSCRLKTHQNRCDNVSLPPRSCPWCRQHQHFHRRSQTFSWMWQSTLITKPVLCSRAGFLMH